MGKGAGSCGARGAMSLHAASELPLPKAAQQPDLQPVEQQAHAYNRLFDSAIPALETLSYCYPAQSVVELEELQSVLTEGTAKQKQELQQGLDFLREQGWAQRVEDTSALGYYQAPTGHPAPGYKITDQGENRFGAWLDVEIEIDQRQRVFEQRERAAHTLEKISLSDTCAAEMIDYLSVVAPHRPNQAHFAEQLGRTSTEISRAIKLLNNLGLLSKQGGKQSYYLNRPTYYDLTDRGMAAYDLTQEERSSSPSIGALMAE